MSTLLESLIGEDRRAACEANDAAMRTVTHAHLMNTTRTYPRTLDSAFKTPRYAAAVERPLPPLWKRVWGALTGETL